MTATYSTSTPSRNENQYLNIDISSVDSFYEPSCKGCLQQMTALPCSHWVCSLCRYSESKARCPCCEYFFRSLAVEYFNRSALNYLPTLPMTFFKLYKAAVPQTYNVYKLRNIPWACTIDDIAIFLGASALGDTFNFYCPIHIIMEKSSGKTMDAFIEVPNIDMGCRLSAIGEDSWLNSRKIQVCQSSQNELQRAIFPKWKGDWIQGVPYTYDSTEIQYVFIMQEEMNQITNHFQTQRSPFVSKSPHRPYDCLISIISKFPWYSASMYKLRTRNMIYEASLVAIRSLRTHLKKSSHIDLNFQLFGRLLSAITNCPCFTLAQKYDAYVAGNLSYCMSKYQSFLYKLPFQAITTGQVPLEWLSHLHIILQRDGLDKFHNCPEDMTMQEATQYELNLLQKIASKSR